MPPSIDALFAEIEESDNRATYVVLADALVEAGDPRGELMQVQLALDAVSADYDEMPVQTRALPRPDPDTFELASLDRETTKALKQKLRLQRGTRAMALLGPLAGHEGIALDFRYGLLDRVRLTARVGFPTSEPFESQTIARVLATIFASPEARMLRTIEISLGRQPDDNSIRRLADWLVGHEIAPPSSLRTVRLGDASFLQEYQIISFEGESYSDDLSTVLDAFPHVHELVIDLGTTQLTWTPLQSNLRHLAFLTHDLRLEQVDLLARSALPKLQSFELWTGASYYVNTREDLDGAVPRPRAGVVELEPVLAMLDGCSDLRRLGIGNHVGNVAELIAAIGVHPLAARLTTLDLSYADAIDGAALAPVLAPFAALKELVFDGVRIPYGAQRLLEAGGRTVLATDPLGEERFRYVVTQE